MFIFIYCLYLYIVHVFPYFFSRYSRNNIYICSCFDILHARYIYYIYTHVTYMSPRTTIQVVTQINQGRFHQFDQWLNPVWNRSFQPRKWTWWCQGAGIGPSVTGPFSNFFFFQVGWECQVVPGLAQIFSWFSCVMYFGSTPSPSNSHHQDHYIRGSL